jgi:orotate phosphoribosyltransferase
MNKLEFDVIAGIETAGIPHSAALGYALKRPSVFVRKQVKDHGTKKRVEGGSVEKKNVLLIEDHITTGGSSLSGVEGLRGEGGVVTNCLAITNYEFPETADEFQNAGVKLFTLTSFSVILEEALKQQKITQEDMVIIKDWLQEPHGWADRHGFSKKA